MKGITIVGCGHPGKVSLQAAILAAMALPASVPVVNLQKEASKFGDVVGRVYKIKSRQMVVTSPLLLNTEDHSKFAPAGRTKDHHNRILAFNKRGRR